MKAIEKLKDYIEYENRLGDLNYAHYSNMVDYVNEAIKELEVIEDNIKTSIEEIEYALAKPEYANVYLNNALRFLKERK